MAIIFNIFYNLYYEKHMQVKVSKSKNVFKFVDNKMIKGLSKSSSQIVLYFQIIFPDNILIL